MLNALIGFAENMAEDAEEHEEKSEMLYWDKVAIVLKEALKEIEG